MTDSPPPFDGLTAPEVAETYVHTIWQAIGTLYIVRDEVWPNDAGILNELLAITQEALDHFDSAASPSAESPEQAVLRIVMSRLPLGSGVRPRYTVMIRLLEGILHGETADPDGICQLIVAQIQRDRAGATHE